MEMTPVNFRGILSETKRISEPYSIHFFALSLFFLPLAFSLVITPALHLHVTDNFFTGDLFHKFLANHQNVLIFHLLYFLIVYFFAICAIGTISYSTYQAFIGKPVNYLATLKSLTFSFFPLISTVIVANVILFAISLAFFMVVVKIPMMLKTLGFVTNYYISVYFIVIGTAAYVATITYVHMNWCLAPIVVVAESKWGPAALIRSWYLVKGMRSVSSSLLLYYLFSIGFFECLTLTGVYLGVLNGDSQIVILLFTMLGSFLLMMGLYGNTAANTGLYMYCKGFHGELGLEIAEGFDYINLPSDGERGIMHVVTVVEAN